MQQCPVPVMWEYGRPYNKNWGPPPYPGTPEFRPPQGAPPNQTGKGQDPQAPPTVTSKVWWTPPDTWPPLHSTSAPLTPTASAGGRHPAASEHRQPGQAQPTTEASQQTQHASQAPAADDPTPDPAGHTTQSASQAATQQDQAPPIVPPLHPSSRIRPQAPQPNAVTEPRPDRARRPGLFAQAPRGTPNLQDWPLVSAEKVCKNPLLRGCVACQIPCQNCTGRLCKRTCAPFVTAHRGHHCNECYKRLGRHGQADRQKLPHIRCRKRSAEATSVSCRSFRF